MLTPIPAELMLKDVTTTEATVHTTVTIQEERLLQDLLQAPAMPLLDLAYQVMCTIETVQRRELLALPLSEEVSRVMVRIWIGTMMGLVVSDDYGNSELT